ncbi:unnamed protein product [Triticum turgidum subsp. durum]|uniref:Myb/SANT-like domain-containing protein n=1 Tax=Triticum turgidum subsp. durum TaxID=4567 RepID=A0A9R0U2F3_TRITD|nr:unnamed protein product [Triticum turgidum subsp. durum]
MSSRPSSPHTERRSSNLEDRPAGRTAADGRATRPHPGGGQEPPASWSIYRRPASHQAPAASICRKSLQFLQMDDQGRMIDFGIQGHEFSQRTTIPCPNIGHHQDNGLDDLEFTQGATGHQTNIGQDNGLDDLEFSQRIIGRRPNFGTLQRCDDLDFDQRSARQHEDSVSKSKKSLPRAKWSHQMKLYLIQQLKDFNVPGYRTQNAWSKEAWNKIVDNINKKFGLSLDVKKVKQKEQDLKKDFRTVKELAAESGFGWDRIGMKVVAPDAVWESFAERRNTDALIWRDKHFPYYDDLFALYEGRYAEGRNRRGMDYYADRDKEPSQTKFAESQGTNDYDGSPSPNINVADFPIEEEGEKDTSDFPQQQCPSRRSTQMNSQFVKTPEMCGARPTKRQKNSDFQEKYLKLKKEEIERFAAIEEKKLEDPYSISRCVTTLERH